MKNRVMKKFKEIFYTTLLLLWLSIVIGAGIAIGFEVLLAFQLKLG